MRPDEPRLGQIGREPAEPTARELWLGIAAGVAMWLCAIGWLVLVALGLAAWL